MSAERRGAAAWHLEAWEVGVAAKCNATVPSSRLIFFMLLTPCPPKQGKEAMFGNSLFPVAPTLTTPVQARQVERSPVILTHHQDTHLPKSSVPHHAGRISVAGAPVLIFLSTFCIRYGCCCQGVINSVHLAAVANPIALRAAILKRYEYAVQL